MENLLYSIFDTQKIFVRMYKIFFGNRELFLREGPSGEKELERVDVLIDRFFRDEDARTLELFYPDLGQLQLRVKNCFTFVEAGGGVVFNPAGQFLVIRRNEIWDLPKGKMEEGEDFESTALREVKEETGLKNLKISHLIMSTYHTYDLKGEKILKETRWFEMTYSGKEMPEVQTEEGISTWRWVEPGKCEFIERNSYASILDLLRIMRLL